MGKQKYDSKCAGCRRSQGCDGVPGGIVELPGNWILNQYQGDEGFLGWLALQPRWHRCKWTELEPDELEALGENIKKVDIALQQYWEKHFKDPIERLYVVYFYESVFAKPPPLERFHLHIHLIPRSKHVGRLLRKCWQPDADPPTSSSHIVAWDIYKVVRHCAFPEKYGYNRKNKKHRKKAQKLMKYLRKRLESDC